MGTQVHMLKPSIFPAIALLAILTACSNTPAPTTAKQEPEKVEPATGQTAVFRMYQMARAWAPDCEIMKLESMRLSDVKEGARGTASAWQATFVSAARSQSRSYTFSIVDTSISRWPAFTSTAPVPNSAPAPGRKLAASPTSRHRES